MQLAERMRRAREIKVKAGGVTFVARRPTDLEMMEMRAAAGGFRPRDILGHVVGWEGVTEGHLLTGGDPHPLPFDAAACAEWLADRPDLLGPIAEQVLAAYSEHAERLAAEKKA